MYRRLSRFALLCALSLALTSLAQQEAGEGNGVSQGVGVVEAYQRLLKENLQLRSQIGELTETAESKEQQRKQLAGTVADLEQRILELVKQIDKLKAEESKQADPAELKALRARMAAHEREKAQLTTEISDLTSQLSKMASAAAEAATEPAATGPQVAPGSAMYRQLEQENARLRQAVQDMESQKAEIERRTAALRQQTAIQDSAIQELESGKAAHSAEREALLKLAKYLRRMQGEVRELKDEVQTKESRLHHEEERVAMLKQQLDERDDTIRKIKRIGELLDRVDEEKKVRQMPQMAQRDHYRREGDRHFEAGEYKLAEAAYRKALSIDRSYADVHYNLGLLYDQYLGDRNRALIHYKAYVSLRPNADDVDIVRLWIHEAEVSAPVEVPVPEPDAGLTFLLEQAMAPDDMDEAASTHRDFYIAQALAHSKQGQIKDAVMDYTRALEFDPDYADIHYNLGVLYDDYLDQDAKAAQHYRRYLQLRPNAADADQVNLWLHEAELGI